MVEWKKSWNLGVKVKKLIIHAIFALSPQGVNANLSFFRVYKVLTGGERGWGGVVLVIFAQSGARHKVNDVVRYNLRGIFYFFVK